MPLSVCVRKSRFSLLIKRSSPRTLPPCTAVCAHRRLSAHSACALWYPEQLCMWKQSASWQCANPLCGLLHHSSTSLAFWQQKRPSPAFRSECKRRAYFRTKYRYQKIRVHFLVLKALMLCALGLHSGEVHSTNRSPQPALSLALWTVQIRRVPGMVREFSETSRSLEWSRGQQRPLWAEVCQNAWLVLMLPAVLAVFFFCC